MPAPQPVQALQALRKATSLSAGPADGMAPVINNPDNWSQGIVPMVPSEGALAGLLRTKVLPVPEVLRHLPEALGPGATAGPVVQGAFGRATPYLEEMFKKFVSK